MEYEIKVYENLDNIKNYIQKNNAVLVKDEIQLTYIFDNPNKSIFEEVDGILRVRVTIDNINKKTIKTVTIKTLKCNDNGIKTFYEQTSEIDNENALFCIFESLGLKQTEFVEKTRVSYEYKNCLFEFDLLKRPKRTDNYLEIESVNKQNIDIVLEELKLNNIIN